MYLFVVNLNNNQPKIYSGDKLRISENKYLGRSGDLLNNAIVNYFIITRDIGVGRVKVIVYLFLRDSSYMADIKGLLRRYGYIDIKYKSTKNGPLVIAYKIISIR